MNQRSHERLKQCHEDIQKVFIEADKQGIKFIVMCGHRGQEAQDAAYSSGNSKLRYPYSKHNKIPALAIDVAPDPINWNDIESFKELAGKIMAIAKQLKIDIVWGGDWRMRDYPHFQIGL